jgi:uncharacterized membrane protein
MKVSTWLTLAGIIVLLALLPLLFAQVMATSLAKLHLSPAAASLVAGGIILGGFINIPIRRILHDREVTVHPFAIFGLSDLWPELQTPRRETIIAVNVGGCVIPVGLAIYELAHLATLGWHLLTAAATGSMINIVACYILARPVPGVGIVLPGLVPPLIAATVALILAPEHAPPVAFVAGVTGPLVGADVLHLKGIGKNAVGRASIGGAGTFDGIVLSGIVAAYLA